LSLSGSSVAKDLREGSDRARARDEETMRRGLFASLMIAALATLSASLPACSDDSSGPNGGQTPGGGANAPGGPGGPGAAAPTPEETIQKILDARKVDYGEALRTASLKLRNRLPDLAEIKQVGDATSDAAKKTAYEKLVDDMIASPDFARTMIKYWKDTFKTAQVGDIQGNVNRDGAPLFAAEVTVEARSFTELFTATTNTCPTFDGGTAAFTAASCAKADGAVDGPTVGILTDPGLMSQFFSNMAFRRVRFIQETFACSKFPAEFSANPVPMGSGVYTGVMPFTSITGSQNTTSPKVDFQDTKAVICANCHINLNHIAPLFLNWDANGALKNGSQVKVPIPSNPNAARADYLPASESFAWRNGKPVTDIAGLGKAMADDPDVASCAVNRIWDYAMSRGDIVADAAPVPKAVTQPYVDKFVAGGMKLKETIRDVFKSEDFTKF
jgi:hypothetical protein